jgi:hypothetical protein
MLRDSTAYIGITLPFLYLTGNTLRLHYKVQTGKKKIAVYYKNQTKHTNALCGQNAKFHHVKAGGTYSNHSALKGEFLIGTGLWP